MGRTSTASPEQLLGVARITMESSKYCFLVTLGPAGPDARLMQPFAPEDDLTVRFGTGARSRKAREIGEDGRVVLAYSDPTEVAYVVIVGTAYPESDPKTRRRYWREQWRSLYPEGPEGEDYLVFRCVPERVELMNLTREVSASPYGVRPAVVVRAGEGWRLAEEEERR